MGEAASCANRGNGWPAKKMKCSQQSWAQAKNGRSCGSPTGEFAPVKVQNEFVDGKICQQKGKKVARIVARNPFGSNG